MDRANELLDYYADNPPSHLILAAAFLDPKKSKRRAHTEPTMRPTSELAEFFGPAQPLPEHLRKMVEWTEANLPKLVN